jgi:hypothetical protein
MLVGLAALQQRGSMGIADRFGASPEKASMALPAPVVDFYRSPYRMGDFTRAGVSAAIFEGASVDGTPSSIWTGAADV